MICKRFSECAALCKRGWDPARTSSKCVGRVAWCCQPLGEMAELEGLEDGEPPGPRDSFAAGEGFVDPECSLLLLECGEDAEGAPVTVQCMVVGEIGPAILLAFPATAWRRKIASRTVSWGGLVSRLFSAEVDRPG